MVKQVIILRKDLNMRKGKMIAQGAHASMAVILNEMENVEYHGIAYQEFMMPRKTLQYSKNGSLDQWLNGSFTKVVVGVDSEIELLHCYALAKNKGLLCSLIQDTGKTEFSGVPTYTAVAIGPAYSKDIDKITGNLKLL